MADASLLVQQLAPVARKVQHQHDASAATADAAAAHVAGIRRALDEASPARPAERVR